MMEMPAAPPPSTIEAPARVPKGVGPSPASDQALKALKSNLPKTGFKRAWPSQMPGLIAVELENGEIAYTDKTGRFLIIGLVLDSYTGKALDNQLDGKTSNE